jgi:hypothetical protein
VENFSGTFLGPAARPRQRPDSFSGLSDAGVSPHALSACSACAGDYEDPDRTAWPEDTDEDEANSQEQGPAKLQEGAGEKTENEAGDADVNDDEFPAQEA